MSHIDQTNRTALLVGLGTVAIALVLRWINVRLRIRLPELLLAIHLCDRGGRQLAIWTNKA